MSLDSLNSLCAHGRRLYNGADNKNRKNQRANDEEQDNDRAGCLLVTIHCTP